MREAAHFALDDDDRFDHEGDVTDDIAQLARRLDELERTQAKLQAERDQYRVLYQEMLERCRKLELGLRTIQPSA